MTIELVCTEADETVEALRLLNKDNPRRTCADVDTKADKDASLWYYPS